MDLKKTQSIIEQVIYEFFGNGNLSGYEQLVEKDVKVHYPPSCQNPYPSHLRGRENVKAIDLEYSTAFQIKKIEINDLILERKKQRSRQERSSWKHGRYSKEGIARNRALRAMLKESKDLLALM